MKKVLVTGAAGMLGTAIIDLLHIKFQVIATDCCPGYAPHGVSWKQINLLDEDKVSEYIQEEKPDIIVHCAAFVDVDGCEKNPELAMKVNANTTVLLSSLADRIEAKIIYISTDSVFPGDKKDPYSEEDTPEPKNIYAKSKYEGEKAVLKYKRGIVLRTNIFGWSRAEKISFSEWVLKGLVSKDRLTMFNDVQYTPIHVSHLSHIVERVSEQDLNGLFHATGSTVLSKYEFAVSMANIFGLSTDFLIPVSIDDVGLGAKRPKNMALDNSKLCAAFSWKIPSANEGIALLKSQCDSGWLALIKGRTISENYRFWEI